ncbi:glutathione S-transferase family protein [Thalassobaculum sp.]|uniref:glutathione S-transferase family protein n=1 Tax=Thalassobaculum sp. TaxID=2022740 RepID=UPI0032F0585C
MPVGSELILYHAAPSRSSVAHWMLEEVGHPYEMRILDLKKLENRAPEYLAVNPMGKVPALVHGGTVITESAAICCHLADAFPEARLNFPVGDPRRGPYLKWLFFGPSCIEPAMIDRMMQRETGPRSAVGYGDYDTTIGVVADALRLGPYLFGETFTAADVVIGSTLRWGMLFELIPDREEFKSYVARLGERPALKRAQATDAELAPPSAD